MTGLVVIFIYTWEEYARNQLFYKPSSHCSKGLPCFQLCLLPMYICFSFRFIAMLVYKSKATNAKELPKASNWPPTRERLRGLDFVFLLIKLRTEGEEENKFFKFYVYERGIFRDYTRSPNCIYY